MATINRGEGEKAGNPEWFTGEVAATVLSEPSEPEGVRVITVDFSPGARSGWHSHDGGQVLHVISGEGVVANSDGQVMRMATGDTVTVPAGELHWHGATPDSAMLQMSITSKGPARWTGEKISDEEYEATLDRSG